jgi:hypothetical protein
MSVSEYVLIFNSIVLGLAVADVLFSFHRLLRARARVKWYWMTPVLGVLMLLQAVNLWWGSYDWIAHVQTMSMAAYLPILAMFVTVFLLLAAALPDEVPSAGLDLKAWHLANARYFWVLWALQIALALAWYGSLAVRYGASLSTYLRDDWINMGALCVALLLVFVRRLWLDSIYIIVMICGTIFGAVTIVLQ